MLLKAVLGTYDDYEAARSEMKKFSKIFPDYQYKIKKTGNRDFPYRVIYTLKKGHTEPGSKKRLKELDNFEENKLQRIGRKLIRM